MLIGNTSGTVGYITATDKPNNILKVKLANSLQEFISTEYVHSNIAVITGTTSGDMANSRALPFVSNVMTSNITSATSLISSITPSTFIAQKNAFTQNPIVRLYSIYYPGEWYPPNSAGNPSGMGEGRSWPVGFPLRFAEVVGDTADDLMYNVTYGGTSFIPFPVNISGIEQTNEGRINELSLTVFNVDNIVSRLVEDPYLVGNNISNSVMAHVNGELVHGIDPRTVPSSWTDFPTGSTERALLKAARDKGLNYSTDIVNEYGQQNAAFTYEQTQSIGGTWITEKPDSRDLLGGVVEIKTTFANFLDYWPEHSSIVSQNSTSTASTIEVKNAAAYRVGDSVRLANSSRGVITSIVDNKTINIDRPLLQYKYIGAQEANIRGMYFKPTGDRLYISGNSSDRVREYTLSNWNVDQSTFLRDKSVSAQDGNPADITFKPDGTKMYLVGTTSNSLFEYSLSEAWNVSSANLTATVNVSAITTENNATGVAFSANGANVYIIGFDTDTVYQMSVPTAWSISSIGNTVLQSKSITSQETSPYTLSFSSSGDYMYVVGNSGDDINQYTLSSAWNVATAAYTRIAGLGDLDGTMTAHAWADDGTRLFVAGQGTDNVYRFSLTEAWNVATLTSSLAFTDKPLYIVNAQADSESYIEDKFRIDQLEGLADHVATFGLVSWLQYFKISLPRRKYYKNTCQWTYKGAECQYPGPGGIEIPGTSPILYSTKSYNLQNEDTTIKSVSLVDLSGWENGLTSVPGYTNYGDGNSLKIDRTPYNKRKVVWDVSNQDAAADSDGGFYTPRYAINKNQLYRFSVWIRRKTIGNGQSYLSAFGYNSSNVLEGLLRRSDGVLNTNPHFNSINWTLDTSTWYLFVGHVWPVGSGIGGIHPDSGIYKKSSLPVSTIIENKISGNPNDWVWQTTSTQVLLRALLHGSTDTTTNQQFYQPRIDLCDGNEPSLEDILIYPSEQLESRAGEDICAKSFAACTLRNNQIHYGGFPGVGRTIPRA